jgi:hypothetical protein
MYENLSVPLCGEEIFFQVDVSWLPLGSKSLLYVDERRIS